MAERPFIAVCMMTNKPFGTLYVGVTADLYRRVEEHRSGALPGFTQRYGLKRLVWYENFEGMVDAIQREKSLKRYHRDWKLNLIARDNLHWDDLYPQLMRG